MTSLAHDGEERVVMRGEGGGEWGEGEELRWGANELQDALGVLGEGFIAVVVEGSGRGRRWSVSIFSAWLWGGMSRGEKGIACVDGLLLSIVVSCSILSSWNFMKNEVDN
jgi:hypothetical protein